jgi:transposase
VIKVRKDASVHAFECVPRKLVLMEQLRNKERWKRRHGYGQRARAESAISSFKRAFGEHIDAVRWENAVNELLLKAQIYNIFVGMMNP